jgi:hypothetical protein
MNDNENDSDNDKYSDNDGNTHRGVVGVEDE